MIRRVGVDPRDVTRALADLSPEKLPGLACWLRADAGVTADALGSVSTVEDQSAGRLKFTAPEPRRQPVLIRGAVNGLPALRFATSGDRGGRVLNVGDLKLPASNGLTILAVARVQRATWFGPIVTAFDEQRRDYTLGLERMTGAMRGAGTDALAGQGFKVLVASYDAGLKQYTAYVNGKRVAQQEMTQVPTTLGGLRLGSEDEGEGHGLVGDLAEAMVFTRPLSEAERTALVGHAMKKYALSTAAITPLAAKLPYAYYPSTNELEVAFDADSPLVAEYTGGVYRPAVVPAGDARPGLAFAYFTDENACRNLAGLDKLVPAAIGVLPQLSILGTDGKPFATYPRRPNLLVSSGYVDVPREDVYTFHVRPYCDSLLLVDGADVNRITHNVSYNGRGGAVALAAGKHAIALYALVRNHPVELPTDLVLWSSASIPRQPIPADRLSHTPVMNYAGRTPRGGKIVWEKDDLGNAKCPKWVPTIFRVEEGPADGVIWDSTKTVHWSTEVDRFCPYIWLGQEERGLCWFGGDENGYALDGRSPVQEVIRRGDQVILRVHFVQSPVSSAEPRRIVFGLQASPTKRLTGDWRAHYVPAGGGCAVHPYGGYQCADKYPDGRDFGIVDKMLEALKSGVVDQEYFARKNERRVWLDDKVHDDGDWLRDVVATAHNLKNTHDVGEPTGAGTYTEEHAQNVRTEEWQVFQDEWSTAEFNRFQDFEGNWSQMAASYRDFAVYYNHQWLKRGVSVYFDNCYHRISTNPYNQDFHGRTVTIWGQRAYNKRVWKAMAALNLSGGAPYRVDFTGHITNGQILPQNTWFSATLDLEQEYRTDTARKPAYPFPATASKWVLNGYKLTFPADYTRAMSMGRTVGTIAHAMHPLNNFCDYRETELLKSVPERAKVADWGMFRVHDMRGGGANDPLARRFDEYLRLFGYGQPGVRVFNYWDDQPYVAVSDPRIAWLAMTRASDRVFGMLLLQSYREEEGTDAITVRFPGGGALQDLKTRQVIPAEADGAFRVPLENMQGTRLFLVTKTPADAVLPTPAPGQVLAENFEFGLHARGQLPRIWAKAEDQPLILDAQTGNPANQVLKVRSVHGSPAWHFLSWPEVAIPDDCQVSLKFRLPSLPARPGTQGVLTLQYRLELGKDQHAVRHCELRLHARVPQEGKPHWEISAVQPYREGKPVAFDSASINLIGKPIPAAAVDTQWHRLTVAIQGPRQIVKLDDTLVLDARCATLTSGTVRLSPGHDLETSAVKYIEVDDLSVTAVQPTR